MLKKVEANEKERTIVIVLDLDEPQSSASGKTLVVGTTRGNKVTSAMVGGKPVIVGANCYISRI